MIPASALVHPTFLGLRVGAGVAQPFAGVLARVERDLEHRFPTLHGRELGKRLGVNAGLIGWRNQQRSFHGKGRAVDIEYAGAPYIAVRSKINGVWVYGGEAAARGLGLRGAACAVYDRAVAWVDPGGPPADVACRRSGEGTGAVWDRFRRVSDALGVYLGAVFLRAPGRVTRPVGAPPAPAELVLDDAARATISQRWPGSDVDAIRAQIVADFDAVRLPMVFGMPSKTPARTRNPVRGFLPFARELAVSMCDVGGCRWGMCDFGPGASGDSMHFDR